MNKTYIAFIITHLMFLPCHTAEERDSLTECERAREKAAIKERCLYSLNYIKVHPHEEQANLCRELAEWREHQIKIDPKEIAEETKQLYFSSCPNDTEIDEEKLFYLRACNQSKEAYEAALQNLQEKIKSSSEHDRLRDYFGLTQE